VEEGTVTTRQDQMAETFQSERERAFEAKFARDEEFKFRLAARRDKLLAHWAADLLGFGEEARAKLQQDILAVMGYPRHEEAVLRLLAERLKAGGIAKTNDELSTVFKHCTEQTRDQLMHAPLPNTNEPSPVG
jgi:hypothetical protein